MIPCFSADQIAVELNNIFAQEASVTTAVNIVTEDVHQSKSITIGLGGNSAEYTYTHHSHSLLQYYYWPDGQTERMELLNGNAGVVFTSSSD